MVWQTVSSAKNAWNLSSWSSNRGRYGLTEGQQNMAAMAIICLKMNFKGECDSVKPRSCVTHLGSSWKTSPRTPLCDAAFSKLDSLKVSSQIRRKLDGGPKHSANRCASFGIKCKATHLQDPVFFTLILLFSVRRILADLPCQNSDETYLVC